MNQPQAPSRPLRVWDVPVRLFHWTLVALVVISFTTAQIGGNAMQYHEYPGHNPLGGWMVVLLLASVLVQAATGLYANDDIMMEGPLAKHVSKETSDLATRLHHLNFNVLLGLVTVHVAAALYYLRVKRENLILPLVTGYKRVPETFEAQDRSGGPLWLAVVLLAASAGAVWAVLKI
jgi:cytochrome b